MLIILLFFIKNKNLFESTEKYIGIKQQGSLNYDPNTTVADLVNKSTTGDGIPDWEKILFGLDPAKKENVRGVPDSVTIEKLKIQQTAQSSGQVINQDNTNLTQTDKFSREFLATVTTLDQSGAIDQNGNMSQDTVDKLSSSLSDSVQNSPQRKIYTLSDLNITNDASITVVEKYNEALNGFYKKLSTKYNVVDILQKFAPDDTGLNVDPTVLPELDPIINELNNFIAGMVKIKVPQKFANLHLNMLNGLEGIVENLNDVKLYDTDPIVAFSGVSKYNNNVTNMESAAQQLADEIKRELKTP